MPAPDGGVGLQRRLRRQIGRIAFGRPTNGTTEQVVVAVVHHGDDDEQADVNKARRIPIVWFGIVIEIVCAPPVAAALRSKYDTLVARAAVWNQSWSSVSDFLLFENVPVPCSCFLPRTSPVMVDQLRPRAQLMSYDESHHGFSKEVCVCGEVALQQS